MKKKKKKNLLMKRTNTVDPRHSCSNNYIFSKAEHWKIIPTQVKIQYMIISLIELNNKILDLQTVSHH